MVLHQFRFSGSTLVGEPPANSITGTKEFLCCAEPTEHAEEMGSRRARLTELDSNFHCSVIGTCLSTAELRKLIPRFIDVDRKKATDLELHHEAVQLAYDAGAGAKAMHKALDQRYESTIKRLQKLKTADALRVFWKESLQNGEVPGAYWALMTHPQVTPDLRKLAFGDVHMLSHLVGAANRADIRRLQSLEQENAALSEKMDRYQERFQELITEREELLSEQTARATRRISSLDNDEGVRLEQQSSQVQVLKTELEAKEQALAHHTHRRELAETQLQQQHQAGRLVQEHLDKTRGLVETLHAELQALEAQFDERLGQETPAPHLAVFRGQRVVYVGGRPSSNRTIRSLVEAAGGELILHDGGLEDRKGLLAAALPRADLVVFPVDCIDHDSVFVLKRLCEKHQIPYHPLRTASAASFSALMARLASTASEVHARSFSRFCIKHR